MNDVENIYALTSKHNTELYYHRAFNYYSKWTRRKQKIGCLSSASMPELRKL